MFLLSRIKKAYLDGIYRESNTYYVERLEAQC